MVPMGEVLALGKEAKTAIEQTATFAYRPAPVFGRSAVGPGGLRLQ